MSDTLRQDEANIGLTVDGREFPGLFSKRDGGEATSEESKTFPAGGHTQQAHGGQQTVENVTLGGEFVPDRDNADIQFLKTRRGKGDASVVEYGLDGDGNVIERLNSWTGKLMSVNTGSYDANSNDPREFEIVISTHGVVG
jgi:hypothetical protein